MRRCRTSKTAAMTTSARAIRRRATSRFMAYHRKVNQRKKPKHESQQRKSKMEASYEAHDPLVATRSAKRVPWVLRADGASCSGPPCLHSLLPTGKMVVN